MLRRYTVSTLDAACATRTCYMSTAALRDLKKVKDAFGPTNWASFANKMPNWENDLRPDRSNTIFTVDFHTTLIACGIDPLKTPAMAAALVEHFQVSAPSTSKTLTMEMLEAEFGRPKYDPDVKLEPLSGTPIERDNIISEFTKYCSFLLQDDKTKPKGRSDPDSDYYPLVTILGRRGAGKTFGLKLIGHDAVKRGSVVALISFGNGSPVSEVEKQNNKAAISVRILFSLWRHVGWSEFSEFCHRHSGVPSINRAIEVVCHVAGKPTSPFVLLVDESNSGGEEFCSKVLTTVGQWQQDAIQTWKEGHGQPLFVISTSLRPDYLQPGELTTNRPIRFIDLPPFSRHAMRKLKDDWCEKLHVKENGAARKNECDVFVSQVLQYTGGLPRAVEWAHQRVFGKSEIDLNKYYSTPTFDVVKMCLLGEHVTSTDTFVSDAISRFGVSVDDNGHPSLPPFQLYRWAALERETDTAGSVAQVLMSCIPMHPPTTLGDSTNAGRQQFAKLTVAFELVQGILSNGAEVSIPGLFGEDGMVTNLDYDEALVRFTATELDNTLLENVPLSLFERKNDRVLRLLDEGKRVVGPQNPNKCTICHASVVIFGDTHDKSKTLWLAQTTSNKFGVDSDGRCARLEQIVKSMDKLLTSDTAVIGDFERGAAAKEAKEQCSDLLDGIAASNFPQRKIFVVYTTQEDDLTDVSQFPENTIVVTRRGSERMLSGLGGAMLMFE